MPRWGPHGRRVPGPLTKETGVTDFLSSWGYLGVFLGIIATGIGFPMPEELPIVIGGGLAGSGHARWYVMLPVCIVGVIIGDSFLYGIGRYWGPRLLQYNWVKTKLLPPARLEAIERNFQQYGIRILLFARLTPGIRAPIFFTAGLTKLSVARFLIADGIYAIPGVTLLFFLGYWFTEGMIHLITHEVERVKYIVIIVVIVAVVGYMIYKVLRKPVVTGDPHDMPKLVEQMTHVMEEVTTKIIHPHRTVKVDSKHRPPSAPAADGAPPTTPDGAQPAPHAPESPSPPTRGPTHGRD
jgi:membrane protein DedA with SNARE-associated domain